MTKNLAKLPMNVYATNFDDSLHDANTITNMPCKSAMIRSVLQ
jgi:hypothetical protein